MTTKTAPSRKPKAEPEPEVVVTPLPPSVLVLPVNVLACVLPFCGHETSRHAIRGVYIEPDAMTATNGAILCTHPLTDGPDVAIILRPRNFGPYLKRATARLPQVVLRRMEGMCGSGGTMLYLDEQRDVIWDEVSGPYPSYKLALALAMRADKGPIRALTRHAVAPITLKPLMESYVWNDQKLVARLTAPERLGNAWTIKTPNAPEAVAIMMPLFDSPSDS